MTEVNGLFNDEGFPITYEIPSPRGGDVSDYLDDVEDYDFLKDLSAVNICNNPVGLVRIDPAPYAYLLKKAIDIRTIVHLTCRDSTLSGLQKWLLGAQCLGIKNLLAMSGDVSMGDYPAEERVGHINSLELITGVKQYLNQGKLMPELSSKPYRTRNRYMNELENLEQPTDFNVGGVLIPARRGESEYAAKKIKAGADFFQTQISYDVDETLDCLEDIEEESEDTPPPVLVSTTPLASRSQMDTLIDSIPQVNIPKLVRNRFLTSGDFSKESIAFTVEFYKKLISGAEERGLKTKVGAHIIPMQSEENSCEIIRGLSEL
ncbi:MAG: methylenetetrahydrofolate reductase [Candidatus Saliniplasma sp.]